MNQTIRLFIMVFLGVLAIGAIIAIGIFLLPFILLAAVLYLLFGAGSVRVGRFRPEPPPAPEPDEPEHPRQPEGEVPASEDIIDVTAVEVSERKKIEKS